GTVVPADPAKAMDITPPVTRFAPMFSDIRIKVLVAPQLQVGDAVEFQYTRAIRTPYMAGNFWADYSLDRANPITAATVVLDVPASRKLTFKSDPCFPFTVKKENGRKQYRWQIAKLDPPKSFRAYRPPLFAASTLSSWKQVADWYTNLQSDGTRITPEIQALAAKLTAGQTTPEQKVDAIYGYVSEKIRYVALEFGIGGYQAHAAGVVLASGYGDCKDKSDLLATLLAAAGIKAYPALVNAVASEIEPAVPMPSQFDHVMTVVPLNGKDLWLDSTMETAPPGVLSPAVLGKQALLIEPGFDRLVSVPDAPPTPQQSGSTVTGSIDAAGKLTLKDSNQVGGIAGVFWRQVFRLQDKNQLANVVKRLSQLQVPGANASDWSSSDPDDLSSPFKYQYTLTRPAFLDLLQKNESIRLPVLFIAPNSWRNQIAQAEQETKDQAKAGKSSGCATNPPQDIRLYGPLENQETLNLAIPANYRVDLPEPIQVERPFGTYSSSYRFDHGHLEVRRDLKIDRAKIALAQLDALRNFQSLINADLSQKLTLRRTGSADILSDTSSMTADELTSAGYGALYTHHKPVLARDLFLKAVTKDPKNRYAWNDLGASYAALGNYYQAEKAYRKQLAMNPYDQYAYNNLGRLEMAQQHYDRAIADYKQQLSVNPLDRFANPNLAVAYDSKRDWSDAAAAYAATVRIIPGNAALYVSLGTDLLRSGKTTEGQRAFDQAIEIGKQPVILNNMAYGLAQSGVDLAKAEGYARSAVDQTIPENVASLDVPKNYDASLSQLSAYLDTLGVVLYKEHKLDEAGSCLRAAFQMRHIPDGSRHLAMLAMLQNDPQAALRYASYAAAQFGGTAPYIPKSLEDYLQSHGGLPATTATRAAEIHKQEQELDRVAAPQGHPFTLPKTASAAPAWVALNVLVNEQGRATDAKLFRGSEPYSTAALSDVRELHFPPLAWTGHALATVRSVFFLYDPTSADAARKVIMLGRMGNFSEPTDPASAVVYDAALPNTVAQFFMTEGRLAAGLQVLQQEAKDSKNLPEVYRMMVLLARQLKRTGQLDAAAAVLRQAEPLQPKDDLACRQLAETLSAAGDRAGAVQVYQQLIQLDPEDARAHYSLGADYEAQAGPGESPKAKKRKRRGKSPATRGLELALAQYSQAANLDPGNATYRGAFSALYEKIHGAPPPAGAKTGAPDLHQ
ncbi:MAG: DUF3857 domain-containing protein, partial [Terriglobia bacterium]